jgi:hypothetical protein
MDLAIGGIKKEVAIATSSPNQIKPNYKFIFEKISLRD